MPGRRSTVCDGGVAYLRTDLVFGLEAGGSVGHIAGVVNNLTALNHRPLMVTPSPVPTVDPVVDVAVIEPDGRYADFPTLSRHYYNLTVLARVHALLETRPPSWLYHRYAMGSFSAAALADHFQVPLVLEYNGSELWIERHWGGGRNENRFDVRVEDLMLHAAEVLVVVSEPLRDELVERGVEAERILVNPNGVDVERYRPDLDPQPVRHRLGLDGRTVIGFIGTFGAWHGAEVLAQAFVRLRHEEPELASRAHLLMIGDGVKMAEVKRTLEDGDVEGWYTLTGTVPQEEGPSYLAACDILASPHVPNPDGSRFFGSPTKLFEYLAMGTPIVASDLDQIGAVLSHGETAWLVQPGSVDSLVAGLRTLLEQPELRRRLGEAARRVAVERHTWRRHTERIVEKVMERCG